MEKAVKEVGRTHLFAKGEKLLVVRYVKPGANINNEGICALLNIPELITMNNCIFHHSSLINRHSSFIVYPW